MRTAFKTLAAGACLALAGAASVTAAQAFPIYDDASAAPGPIVQARWPCGPGWRPNPWGRCVPAGGYYDGGPGWGYRHAWRGPGWGYGRGGYGGWGHHGWGHHGWGPGYYRG